MQSQLMLSLRINRGDKMKKYLIAIIGLLIIGVSFAGCRHIKTGDGSLSLGG